MGSKYALLGNPNCGKTMLFNALTGSNQYVGNWPGVTVERKEGRVKGYKNILLADLPGIYSLSSYSLEEKISRDFILKERPDVIIDIVDGTNLERNLYLTLQAIETGVPVVVAVNMMDEVRKRGDRLDCARLSALLGVPVVPISAKKKENLDHLLREAEKASERNTTPPSYGIELDSALNAIQRAARCSRCEAVGIFEGAPPPCNLDRMLAPFGEAQERQIRLASARYEKIASIINESFHPRRRRGASAAERIDRLALNKYLGYPLFLGVMLLIFLLTFETVGKALQEGVEWLFQGVLSPLTANLLSRLGAPQWADSLVVDGILGGVGSVLSFVPVIVLLFFFLSLLEDSGYMARAAFLMDRLLGKIGLSGRSFIPMMMGFGCSVPAILAARTMESERDRRLTILLIPFMSCGAKLPVYALFTAAFFPRHQALIIFGMYLFGMAVAVLAGLILSKTVFRGQKAPFLLELPPYRLPSLTGTLRLTWDKAKDFLTRAGTLILGMTVLLWFLQQFSLSIQPVSDSAQSILANIGRWIAPLFVPLGFGTWQAAVSVLSGFVAKEAVVSTMAVLYGADASGSLIDRVQQVFSPAAACSMMVFLLLCAPCMAACAAIKREMNSLKWTLSTYLFQIGTAYFCALLVYQVGRIFL